MDDLRALTRRFPRAGRIEAIYLRPGRDVAARSVHSATALVDRGLEGDRNAAKPPSRPGGGKRQVTLIQAEHVPLIGAWTQRDIDPVTLRRNLLVSGVNLLAQHALFADQPLQVRLGPDVLIVVTGPVRSVFQDGDAAGTRGLQRDARPRRHHCTRDPRRRDQRG